MAARRPGQEALTRERIVETALRIVDEEGLAALSMRRLGTALGTDATAVYYHVPNKSVLHDLLVDAVMREVDLAVAEAAEDPIERALMVAGSWAETLLSHPRVLPLFASRSLTSPDSLDLAECLLGIFLDAGLDHPRGLAAVNAVAFYVLGATTAFAAQILDEDHMSEAMSAMEALPRDRFPNVITALESPGLIAKDVEFESGARALVGGLIGRGHRGGRNEMR